MSDNAAESTVAYYKDPQFVGWISRNGFERISADNISRYYALFGRLQMCEKRNCTNCDGLKATWDSETAIQNGLLTQTRCDVRETAIRENESAEVTKRAEVLIPPLFKTVEFENCVRITKDAQSQILQYVTDYPHNSIPGLYLYSSEHGIGRTTVLWCIIKDLLKKRRLYKGFVLTTAAMFAENLLKDINTTRDHPYFEKALMCDILVLDDFGQEKYTEGYVDKINAILEERYWNLRPIIVSTTRARADWAWSMGQEQIIYSKLVKMTKYIRLDAAEMDKII